MLPVSYTHLRPMPFTVFNNLSLPELITPHSSEGDKADRIIPVSYTHLGCVFIDRMVLAVTFCKLFGETVGRVECLSLIHI